MGGIVSLPYRHPLLSKIRQMKKAYPKIFKVIKQEKSNLLKLENEAVAKQQLVTIFQAQVGYDNTVMHLHWVSSSKCKIT